MEEIRRRHAKIGAGIRVRYNMNFNPLKRSDGKNEDISREGGGELTVYDLLFADDSVFFTKGGKAKSIEMGEIVNEVIKAFGQQVSFKKTEVMMIKSDRKKEVEVIVEA